MHAKARQARGERGREQPARRLRTSCSCGWFQPSDSMHSISTRAPRGRADTPTAARAG